MFTAIVAGYRFLYLQLASLVGFGWAIVALSFICSFLMLPLMRAVAGVVRREKEYEDVIDPQVAAIKVKFASDMDRHFHIQRLYQRYGYSPLAPIKKVLPLFVQIPFLLLTYYMLNGTAQLSDVSFFFLKDLGQPDALIAGINLLPLVMTGVNVLTVFATPGFSHRDWTQAIGISILFLLLLYTAPSALLLYWTLNNTITFVRTLCEKKFAGVEVLFRHVAVPFGMAFRPWWAFVLVLTGTFLFFVGIFHTGDAPHGLTMVVTTRGTMFVLALASIVSCSLLRRETLSIRWLTNLSTAISAAMIAALVFFFLFAREWYRDIGAFLTPHQLCAVFLVLAILPYLPIAVRGADGFRRDLGTVLRRDGYLLVLPIIVAIHYSFSSPGFQLPIYSVALLAIYLLLPAVAFPMLAMSLFRRWVEADVIFRILMGVVVAYYVVPLVATDGGSGLLSTNQNIFARLALAVAVAALLAIVRNRGLVRVFIGLLFVCVIVNSAINNKQDATVQVNHDRTAAEAFLSEHHCVKTNNVYMLFHDGYAQRIVRDGLGLDDGFHVEEFLEEHGFTVYEAYSAGSGTIESMNEVFTIAGIAGESKRSTVSGDSVFNDFLKCAGYRTSYVTCGYLMPMMGGRMPADDYFPQVQDMTKPEQVLFGCILKGVLSQVAQTFNDYSHEEWLSERNRIMSGWGRGGNFIYAHFGLPGHCIGSSRYRESDAEEIAAYKERLSAANAEVRREVQFVEDRHDDDAIVIMASDHGGFLINPSRPMYADARHLLDRHGVLLAVRWPRDYKPVLNLNVLDNVLLEVMIYLSGDAGLARYAVNGATHADIAPLLNPPGLVVNGVYQQGVHKGESLFDAARHDFLLKGMSNK